MSTQPMPTRTRLATVVVALAASAIGFATPAGSAGTAEAPAPPAHPAAR